MKNNKKGFTLVELIIVIAVIAILAAVLIPTFSRIIKNSKVSVDGNLIRNLNTAIATDKALNGEHKTMTDALAAVAEAGYLVGRINKSAADNEILWDSKNDVFCYYNAESKKDNKIEYIPETTLTTTNVKDWEYWQIVDVKKANADENGVVNLTETYNYSIYLRDVDAEVTAVTYDKGVDVGENTVSVNYTHTATPEQEVVIRTNSFGTTLTINAEHDTVNHYGSVGRVDAQKIDMNCYNEYGTAAYVKVTEGKVVAKAGGTISVVFANNTDSTKVAVAKESTGTIERGLTTVQVVDENNFANYAVHLEYSADGVNPYTAEAIETIAQEAINTAIENTVFAGVAVTKSGVATQLMTLEAFRDAVNGGNTYAGYTVKLLDNVDLANVEWTPINGFAGTFDGNYKTLSGLKLNVVTGTSSDEKHIGFFEKTENATIKNLTISDFEVYGTGRIATAALIGNAANGLTLNNVTLTSSNKLTGKWSGGLVGKITTTKVGSELRDCKYIFTNCHSSVEITGERVGGFIGFVGGSTNTIYKSNGFAIFNGCSFNGKLNANTGTAMAGGFTAQFGEGRRYDLTYVYQNCEVDNTNITSIGVKGDFSAFSQSGYSIYNCKVNDGEVTLPTQISFAFGNSNSEASLFAVNGEIYAAWAVNEGYYNITLTTIGENVLYTTNSTKPVDFDDKTSWHKVSNAFVDFNANIIMEANENTLYKGNPPVNIEEGSKLQQRKYIAGWDATNNIHVYNFDMWRIVPSDTAETEDWMDTLVLGVGEYFQDPTDYVDTELYNITSYQSESNNTVYVVVAK